MLKKKNLIEIEILRVLGCIGVIIIHITARYMTVKDIRLTPSNVMVISLNSLFQFVVPLFFFISGYTLFLVYKNKKIDIKSFYKKRFIKIVVPYIIWSFIYMFVNSIIKNQPLSISTIIESLLLGKSFYHLYFIVVIIQFYLLFPLLKKIFDKAPYNLIFIGFLIFNFLFIDVFYFKNSSRFIFVYIIFFILGGVFSLNKLEVDKKLIKNKYVIYILYVAILISFIATKITPFEHELGKYIWHFYSLVSIITIYTVSLLLNTKKTLNSIYYISKNSMFIYFIHPLLISINRGIIIKLLDIQNKKIEIIMDFILIFIALSIAIYIKKEVIKSYNRIKI